MGIELTGMRNENANGKSTPPISVVMSIVMFMAPPGIGMMYVAMTTSSVSDSSSARFL